MGAGLPIPGPPDLGNVAVLEAPNELVAESPPNLEVPNGLEDFFTASPEAPNLLLGGPLLVFFKPGPAFGDEATLPIPGLVLALGAGLPIPGPPDLGNVAVLEAPNELVDFLAESPPNLEVPKGLEDFFMASPEAPNLLLGGPLLVFFKPGPAFGDEGKLPVPGLVLALGSVALELPNGEVDFLAESIPGLLGMEPKAEGVFFMPAEASAFFIPAAAFPKGELDLGGIEFAPALFVPPAGPRGMALEAEVCGGPPAEDLGKVALLVVDVEEDDDGELEDEDIFSSALSLLKNDMAAPKAAFGSNPPREGLPEPESSED